MSNSRKRDGRRLTDAEVEAADKWHWNSIGEASAKLLARLIEHHTRENAARFERTASRSGAKARPTNHSGPSPEEDRHDEQ
jgi:hypothetical protein